MTGKQRRALEQFIGKRASIADVQAIEKMCGARRKVILGAAVRAARSEVVSVQIGGGMGKVLR